MMIEDRFKNWLEFELSHEYPMEDVIDSLTDDDAADVIWDEFCITNRYDILNSVRDQVKSILKKRNQSKS